MAVGVGAAERTPIGRVAGLWRYPVKSMAGESRPDCVLTPVGIPGDRGWALLEASGKAASAKRLPFLMSFSARFLDEPEGGCVPHAEILLPGGERLRTDEPGAQERLSAALKTSLRLGRGPGHFDAFPIHIATTSSLESLACAEPGAAFDVRRFRPNLLVATPASGGFPEGGWLGRRIHAGEAVLRACEPTERCVMTTLPQPGLDGDARVLKTVLRAAGGALGLYARVEQGGRVRLGDAVELGS